MARVHLKVEVMEERYLDLKENAADFQQQMQEGLMHDNGYRKSQTHGEFDTLYIHVCCKILCAIQESLRRVNL